MAENRDTRRIIEPPPHLEPAQAKHWRELSKDIPANHLSTKAQLYVLEVACRHAASIDFITNLIKEMEKQKGIITDKEWWAKYREAIGTRSRESKALTETLHKLMQPDRFQVADKKQSKWRQ